LNCQKQTVTEGGLKAMDEGIAIVVAAVLGSGLSLFISELFRCIHIKTEQKERFFYELYPKRLELYEEIIRETNYISDEELPSGCESAWELSNFYKERCDALAALGYRCAICGSPRVAATLTSLVVVLAEGSKIALSLDHSPDSTEKHSLISMLTPGATAIKLKLIEFIGEESGQHVVDKKIMKLRKEFKARANKTKKKHNNPRKGGADKGGDPQGH
jgi:hypothetical protein